MQGFVHRDIKPENVFVSGKHAMLGDFGLAIAMPASSTSSSAADTCIGCGSSMHAAVSSCVSAGGCNSCTTGRHAALLRSCASTSSLSNLQGGNLGPAAASSSSGQQSGAGVAVIRRSSSCGAVGVFDCRVIPQLKQLQAGGTPAYTAPEVVQATFNNTPLEAAVGPQVRQRFHVLCFVLSESSSL
jgi:serine/threonine protein kinase